MTSTRVMALQITQLKDLAWDLYIQQLPTKMIGTKINDVYIFTPT